MGVTVIRLQPETPVSRLAAEDAVLCRALRALAAAFTRGGGHAAWRDALSAAGVDERGIQGFLGFFSVVAPALRGRLDVRCRCCGWTVSPDEARFIRMVHALRRGERRLAREELAVWIEPASTTPALQRLSVFAAALTRAPSCVPAAIPRPPSSATLH